MISSLGYGGYALVVFSYETTSKYCHFHVDNALNKVFDMIACNLSIPLIS